MANLLHSDLTGLIIGAYYEVYNRTLRTYPESIFERAMVVELGRRGQKVSQQDAYRILYKGQVVGVQQLDLFVLDEVVVELKAVERMTALHKAQGLSYLKTVGKPVGLLLNFGAVEPEFDRLYFDPGQRLVIPGAPRQSPSPANSEWLYPDLTYQIVGGLFDVHTELGPGYVHRIYANACYREFQLRGLGVQPQKRMDVTYKGEIIGDVAFAHLLIEDKVMVFPAAYQDRRVVHLDILKKWMGQCNIQLGITANFQSTRLNITFLRA